jgi:hypothetical protein
VRRRRVRAAAAHREHVAERRLELELERDAHRPRVRVEHTDALAQTVREEARAPDRERLGRVTRRAESRAALGAHELERRDVVLLGVRRQEDRGRPVHAERVPR